MTEDKKIATEMVERDMQRLVKDMRAAGLPVEFTPSERQSEWPDDNGEGTIMMTIGVRGHLTKREARECGAMWRVLGYDEDPREICDIPEAARYVRWWARFAGMNGIETAERYLLDDPLVDVNLAVLGNTSPAGALIGFLAACGVYGDEMKAHAVRNLKPVVAQ